LHPWLQQREIVNYCQQHGIVVEAYCPLVRNSKASDETLGSVANKHAATSSQVLIAYSLKKGWVPLPKSDDTGRIKTNATAFQFALDRHDMELLDGLDQGRAGAIVQAVDN
jgi:diketogulonate reductase-like aldo/keto reductase